MADGGLNNSRSAEGKPGKPGKLSHDLLKKFTPDPGLTQGQLLPGPGSRLSSQSLLWSSEDATTSQENFKSKKAASVRIKEPNESEEYLSPSSADEDMLSDEEAGQEKKKKKRSIKSKLTSPFKRVKSFFKRKKSPTRVKSCEALSTEHYTPTDVQTNAGSDDTLRHRTKSEPSLTDTKLNTSFAEPVLDRPHSDLLSNLNTDELLQGLNKMQGKGQDKSQDSAFEEGAMSSESLHSTGTPLDWSLRSSDGGAEAAVSFENIPNVSSIDGLQAARDKIKAAPKHRRPPTRIQAKTSSVSLKNNPVEPHRRSKTDHNHLTNKECESLEQSSGGGKNSDVASETKLETLEVTCEPSKESVVADLKMKGNDILASLSESPEDANQNNVRNSTEEQDTLQAEREKAKEDLIIESTAGNEQTELSLEEKENENVNDEGNKRIDGKGTPQPERVEENEILKEVNGKAELNRPQLDGNGRSESLQLFEVKGKAKEVNPRDDHSALRKGRSFISRESNVKAPIIALTELIEKPQQSQEIKEHRQELSDLQNSTEKQISGQEESKDSSSSQEESKDSTSEEIEALSAPHVLKKASNKEEVSGQPAWVQLANKRRRSQRLSQLIEDGGQECNKASLNTPSSLSSVPAQNNATKKKNDEKDVKPSANVKERPKVPVKPVNLSQKAPLTKPLPLSKAVNITEEIRLPSAKPIVQKKPALNNQLDKCAVCDRRVYQMEKCNFDSSVLHKQCIKCAVCKRLLTVGNFVMAERKVYCKPHAKTVAVSS